MYPHVTFIPLNRLTRPTDGKRVLADRWWVVHPEHGALIYKRYSPQCNTHPSLPQRLIENRYPGCEVQFIPVAYVEPDPPDDF